MIDASYYIWMLFSLNGWFGSRWMTIEQKLNLLSINESNVMFRLTRCSWIWFLSSLADCCGSLSWPHLEFSSLSTVCFTLNDPYLLATIFEFLSLSKIGLAPDPSVVWQVGPRSQILNYFRSQRLDWYLIRRLVLETKSDFSSLLVDGLAGNISTISENNFELKIIY